MVADSGYPVPAVSLLAQAVSVPIYGKLADLFGRKPVMLFGVALFVVGSLLCGVASGMGTLTDLGVMTSQVAQPADGCGLEALLGPRQE